MRLTMTDKTEIKQIIASFNDDDNAAIDKQVVGVQGCIISPVDMELAILAEDLHKSVAREQYEAALAASKPEWNGEGLPPVGMEIEYKFTKVNYRTDFSRGKVLAYGMHNVFMEHWSSKNEFIQPLDKIEFRPIRSEAEKKRDLIISKIEKLTKIAHIAMQCHRQSMKL